MADLSKIKLNGIEYNIKDTVARNAVSPPLATTTTNGLMSATDKQVLDNLNPNIRVTLSDLYTSEVSVINAKHANMLDLEIIESPHISAQIRTNNLLDRSINTPGYYIGSNGQLSTNANDQVGDFIPVSPGDDIYYTGIIGPTNSSSINRRLHVYNSSKTWIKQMSFAGSLRVGQAWSTHGVVPSNGAYVRVSWGVEDSNVMISIGSPTKYEPYYLTPFESIASTSFQLSPSSDYSEGTTYTINIPAAAGTLYGFTYNPILGKIYKTTAHIATYNGETLPGRWWSDRDNYVENTSPSTGAEVVYMVADEDIVEYDITPLEILMFYQINYLRVTNGEIVSFAYYAETLAAPHITIYDGLTFGSTNITEQNITQWNHAGELIDTKAPIESPSFTGAPKAPTPGVATNSVRIATTEFVQTKMNNIAPVEISASASQNYNVGDYLFTGGQLYKVTAPIANGETLTVGTNITATTVMAEFNYLLSLI